MWSYQLFRIGAFILALNGMFHLFVHFGNKGVKPVNGTEFQLQELMYGYKSPVMGTMRSQGDIYDGHSLGYSVFLFTLAALGFTLPVRRKASIVITASLAVMLGISLTYWFIMPTAFLVAALLCFAGSAYLDK
ncbi:MAG: LIC_13387 family protein [Bryobacteraceae bacterium]